VNRGNHNQGMLDSWLRVASLKGQAFPEVRILLPQYFSYALEAKVVVATLFFIVSRNIAITSSASACTS